MERKEFERQRDLKEAWRIFADASMYSEEVLIGYLKLCKRIYKNIAELPTGDILISKIAKEINSLKPKDIEIINAKYGLAGDGKASIFVICSKYGNCKNNILKYLSKIIKVLQERKANFSVAQSRKNALINLVDNLENPGIWVLELSSRPHNYLMHSGIDTMDKLLSLNKTKLLKINGLGPKSVEEIITKKRLYLASLSNEKRSLLENRAMKDSVQDLVDLGLKKHTYHSIMRAHIRTVEELFSMSDEELMKIKGFGMMALEDVKARRQAYFAKH